MNDISDLISREEAAKRLEAIAEKHDRMAMHYDESCFLFAAKIVRGVPSATDNNVAYKMKATGCEYCQEDGEGYRRMIGAFSITNPFHGKVWQIETAHCKPRQIFFCPMCGRKLAEPPKGEG